MITLNISNPTGTKRNWMLSLADGTILAKAIGSWTQAVDAAQAVASEHGVTDILLHKINGTVTNVPLRKRSASAPQNVPVVEGDVVFIARIQKNIDDDGVTKATVNTLAEAIKSLPRKAHKLPWCVDNFDRHTLVDGRVVSIEKTTN